MEIISNENYFSPSREKNIFLKNSFSSFIVPSNKKLENYFLKNHFSSNQTLPRMKTKQMRI